MAQLRKYNNLTSDAVTTGQKLIVGYINADPALAQTSTTAPAQKAEAPAVIEPPVKPQQQETLVLKPVESEKPAAKPVSNPSTIIVLLAVKDANGVISKPLLNNNPGE
jgi:LysM repeat protein